MDSVPTTFVLPRAVLRAATPMCRVVVTTALLLSSVTAAPLLIQAGQNGAGRASLQSALQKAKAIYGTLAKPLTVNGKVLDPAEVERQTVYMIGQRQMQQKLIEMIIDDQMAEQIKSGVKRETFDVIEGDIGKQIEKTIKEFKVKNPGKDFWAELAKTNTSKAEYMTMQRSTLLFDKVFFRGIPSKWPELTREAIIASGGDQGQQFFDKFAEAVKEGQEVPALWLHICRQWVIGKMQEWSDVRYASDGLSPDVVLSVNGHDWRTKDAAAMLALKIKPEDRTRALIDIALQTALQQALEKKGAWLSDEQYRKEFAEYRKPYDSTPFTVKVLALSFKGYPSFEVYKARWRLERSFEHLIESEINDDNLKKHAKRAKDFLSDGRVSVKVIRIPAFNDAQGTWFNNGFATARATADQVMRDIESKKVKFDAAMKEHSKWPENLKDQGVLLNKSLNELRTELRENEYTDFVHGFSVGELFFYDVKPGTVAGPIRGQDGYYIGMVTDKMPASSEMNLGDKNQRDLVKQDYLSHRFLAWANKVAAATKIR